MQGNTALHRTPNFQTQLRLSDKAKPAMLDKKELPMKKSKQFLFNMSHQSLFNNISALLNHWESSPYTRLATPAFFTLIGFVFTTHYVSFSRPEELGNIVLLGVCLITACIGMFTRYRFPRESLVIECVLAVIVGLNGWSELFLSYAAVVLYRVVARCTLRDAVIAVIGTLISTLTPLFIGGRASLGLIIPLLYWLSATVALAIASRVWHNREREQMLADQERIARKQAEAQREAALRKNRIAEELHDSVGHNLTAIIALSEGLQEVAENDDFRSAIQTLNELARTGLADTRKAVKALSQEETSTESENHSQMRKVADIKQILDTARAGGIAAMFVETGSHTMSPFQEEMAFLIARESVTNALKHASNLKRITVSLDRKDDGWITVTIRNDGESRQKPPSDATGTGLARLKKQIEDLGGSFSAGPKDPDTWIVAGSIPPTDTL